MILQECAGIVQLLDRGRRTQDDMEKSKNVKEKEVESGVIITSSYQRC